MTGTMVDPAPVAGTNWGGSNTISPSYVNSFRISAVADRLAIHVRNKDKNDTVEFFNLCLSLARGIDYAVANSEVPSRVQDLPKLLKLVCARKNDCLLQAAIMVLMISVKNACDNGWFSNQDNADLRSLANEIGRAFCSVGDISIEPSSFLPTISIIMSRFYPQMRIGQILACLNAKPGYDTYVKDFHILKNANSPPEDKIRLFVAQTDNMETSSCIISPQQVNFLLNGKGVDRRTNVFMDTGPQAPTNVTHMLKYGTNLLQAVGHFNGNYLIVVAFMSVTATPMRPVLQDYVQPAVAALDSDPEIIEGPSRISLNCPISFMRIKTPVKGHSCKHLQCFDFDNYMDINSRRPSWRCPHCNQSICFSDIRIDKKMVKVLEEVGEGVADVIISANGSWKAVIESNENRDKQQDKSPTCKQDIIPQEECTDLSNALPQILDLTEGDDFMDAAATSELEDRKPPLANLLSESNVKNLTKNPDTTGTSVINQNAPAHIEDDFWSGIYLSTYGQGTSSTRLDVQNNFGVSESAPTNLMVTPVVTDAITTPLNREPDACPGTALTNSIVQSQLSAPSSTQLQQFGNSTMSNEYGRFPSYARHMNRTPVAVQALPAQTLNSILQQRPRTGFQTSGVPLIADGSNTVFSNVERPQQPRPHINSRLGLSSNWRHQGHSISSEPAQQITGLPSPTQLPSGYRVSSALPTERQNSHQHQVINQRTPHIRSPSSSLIGSPAHFQQSQIHQGGMQNGVSQTPTGRQQARYMSVQQAPHMARQSPSPSIPASIPLQTPRTYSSPVNVGTNTVGTVQPISRTDGIVDSSAAEQNWRPTGRMRGSLSGSAYSAALNQYIIQPIQPVQPARPLSNITTSQSGIASPLHALVANSRNSQATTQAVNLISTMPAATAGDSDVLPVQSSRMQ